MNTATITVKKIFPPNKGGFTGIISSNDERFSVKGVLANQFSEGGKYEISYEETTQGQYTNRTIKTVKPLAGGASITAMQGGKQADSATSENIFVCGAVNALLSGMTPADVTPESIALLTNNLRMGWRRGLVPASKPASSGMTPKPAQPDPDLDDEIPFN